MLDNIKSSIFLPYYYMYLCEKDREKMETKKRSIVVSPSCFQTCHTTLKNKNAKALIQA